MSSQIYFREQCCAHEEFTDCAHKRLRHFLLFEQLFVEQVTSSFFLKDKHNSKELGVFEIPMTAVFTDFAS